MLRVLSPVVEPAMALLRQVWQAWRKELWQLAPSTRGRIADPGLWPTTTEPFTNKDTARLRWRCFDPQKAVPQATLREQGFKGTIYQTHAVATDDFIKLGKDKVEGTVLAAGPMLVIDEIPANPTKKVAQAYIAAYEKQFGTKPATFGANTWDAGLLLERAIPVALKTAKPGTEAFRSALRDALEREREVVGCQGVFNMSPTNHNGMDERARVLVTVRDGKFRLLGE